MGMETDIIKQAIQAAGGATRLANLLGIKAPSIHSWKRVPPARVLSVSKITGIPPWKLRPDIYPENESTGVAA